MLPEKVLTIKFQIDLTSHKFTGHKNKGGSISPAPREDKI